MVSKYIYTFLLHTYCSYTSLQMAHIQFNIFLKLGLLFYSKVCQSQQMDYWSADFDENKNCEKEDEILRLSRMEPSQCQRVVIKNV